MRRFARRAAACVAAAAALAGCSTGSTSTSSVTVTGDTLDIYLSEPAQPTPAQLDVVRAAELAFATYKHDADGSFGLSLDVVQRPKLSDNARQAIQDRSAIAYLGELAPGASEQTVGITNALDLLTVSPTDNALELTQSTPAVPGAPANFYEALSTYGHTFLRLVPSSAQEARFAASLITSLGAKSVFVANDGSDYGKAIAHALESAAGSSLSVRTSLSGAGAVFYGGASPAGAAGFFNRAAASDPSAKLIAPSALNAPAFLSALSSAARANLYITSPGFTSGELNAQGRAFASAFSSKFGHAPGLQAIFGYEAMVDVLDAIEQAGSSASDRAKVIKAFFELKDPAHTVLPAYTFDSSGDTSLDALVYVRPDGTVHALASSPAGG